MLCNRLFVCPTTGVDPSKRPSLFENIYLQTLDQMINNLILYEVNLKDTNIVVDQLTVEESLNTEIKRRIGMQVLQENLRKCLRNHQ